MSQNEKMDDSPSPTQTPQNQTRPSPISGKGSQLVTFQAKHIPKIWQALKPWIKRGMSREDTLGDIYEALLYSEAQLWMSFNGKKVEGILITRIEEIAYLYCLIWICSGHNMENWKDLLPEIEKWAKDEHGCKRMKIIGRKGWMRVLGYEYEATVMGKAL